MGKPATLMLHFSKTGNDGLWLIMVNDAKNSVAKEFSDEYVASFRVNTFSLEDHQFVKVEFNRQNGEEAVAWIPRTVVLAIIEGKAEAEVGYYFGAAKSRQ